MGRPPRGIFALTLLLALTTAPAARVSASELDAFLGESSYTAAQKDSLRAVFTQAGHDGIPADLLLPRLVEGTRKRAAMPRLLEVLDAYRGRLLGARDILQSVPGGPALLADHPSWSLTAALLDAGAAPEDPRALAATAKGRPDPFRASAFLYASLVSWGASRPLSLGVALSALGSSLPPDQYAGLVDVFEQGVRKRISPERLAGRIHESLPGVATIDDLRRAVLY